MGADTLRPTGLSPERLAVLQNCQVIIVDDQPDFVQPLADYLGINGRFGGVGIFEVGSGMMGREEGKQSIDGGLTGLAEEIRTFLASGAKVVLLMDVFFDNCQSENVITAEDTGYVWTYDLSDEFMIEKQEGRLIFFGYTREPEEKDIFQYFGAQNVFSKLLPPQEILTTLHSNLLG